MLNNVSNIEKAFLSLPLVAEAFATKEIKKLNADFVNAQKSKFNKSITLAKLVAKAHAWFISAECKELMATEGIDWTVEDFYKKTYGFGKSYGNRLKQVGNLTDEQIAAYVEEVEKVEAEKGEPQGRDLKELLKFTKTGAMNGGGDGEGDGESEGESEGEGVTWISIAVKGRGGEKGYSLRVMMNGELKGDVNRVAELMEVLSGFAPEFATPHLEFEGLDDEEDEDY